MTALLPRRGGRMLTGRRAEARKTIQDGRSHPREPGRSRGSSASILTFPADRCPQEEGGTGGGRALGLIQRGRRRRHARCVPWAAGNAERKKLRVRVGMQARGRTRTHGKNDNLWEFEPTQICFRRNFCNSTFAFRRALSSERLSRFSGFGPLPRRSSRKMVEVGEGHRKHPEFRIGRIATRPETGISDTRGIRFPVGP